MDKPNKNLRKLRSNERPDLFNPEEFRKNLKDLIEYPTEENVDKVKRIRMWFCVATMLTGHISKGMRGITSKLRNPNEEDMGLIYNMIDCSRRLFENAKLLVDDYAVFRDEGIIIAEIDAFRSAYRDLQEATYFIETVYLSLPAAVEINDTSRLN